LQLAFQVIGNKYVFYGIVDDARANVCFKPSAKAPKSSEEKIKGMKATHILVMMASFLHDLSAYSDESAIRRVVGMHAVSNLVAEQADELVWYTIAQLALKAMVRTRTTTCDGASCFRLQHKINTTGQGRGTANTFGGSRVPNDCEDDENASIELGSDESHWLKKGLTNWYTRDMQLPDYLVQFILRSFTQPGQPRGQHESGETVGCEAYMRLFARVHELLGSATQPAYWTGDEAKDERLRELKDILRIFGMWHEFNSTSEATKDLSKAEQAARGLTHQLFYDTHAMIEAFLGLLKGLEEDFGAGHFRILARRLSQDALESLFGRMRQAGRGP